MAEPAELGAKDGKRWAMRQRATVSGLKLAHACGEAHWRRVCRGEVKPGDAPAYGTAFMQAAERVLTP